MQIFTLIPLLTISILLVILAIEHYKAYIAYNKCLSHEIVVKKLQDWYYSIDPLLTPKTSDIFVANKEDNTVYGEIIYPGMHANVS